MNAKIKKCTPKPQTGYFSVFSDKTSFRLPCFNRMQCIFIL